MIVINEPTSNPNRGLQIREFAKVFGADEIDFENGYDSVILHRGRKAFRIAANSNQNYEFLTIEGVL